MQQCRACPQPAQTSLVPTVSGATAWRPQLWQRNTRVDMRFSARRDGRGMPSSTFGLGADGFLRSFSYSSSLEPRCLYFTGKRIHRSTGRSCPGFGQTRGSPPQDVPGGPGARIWNRGLSFYQTLDPARLPMEGAPSGTSGSPLALQGVGP